MHIPSFVEPDESSDEKVVVMPARTFADKPGLVAADADMSSEVVTVNDTCDIRSACDLCPNELHYDLPSAIQKHEYSWMHLPFDRPCSLVSSYLRQWKIWTSPGDFLTVQRPGPQANIQRKLTYSFTDVSPPSFSFPFALEADLDFFV